MHWAFRNCKLWGLHDHHNHSQLITSQWHCCYATMHSQGQAFCLPTLEFKCHLRYCSSQEMDVSLNNSAGLILYYHKGSTLHKATTVRDPLLMIFMVDSIIDPLPSILKSQIYSPPFYKASTTRTQSHHSTRVPLPTILHGQYHHKSSPMHFTKPDPPPPFYEFYQF